MGDWLGALKKQKNWPGQQVGSWKERNDIKINQLCPLGCFKCDTLSKKNCHASTIPSRAYINHIQKNFFPRTSLEGQTTWSTMVKIYQNRRGGGRGGSSGITVPQIHMAHYATAAWLFQLLAALRHVQKERSIVQFEVDKQSELNFGKIDGGSFYDWNSLY